jgi:hypothetical protein
MRKPYPLSHDLYSLIFEAATEPQRWLHFPLFRHAGTRARDPLLGKRHVNGRWVSVGRDYRKNPLAVATEESAHRLPDAPAALIHSARAVSISLQLELFAAAA